MSYFTETFENILEFKNSVDARDINEKMSGSHVFGKEFNRKGQKDGSEDVRNMKDKHQYDRLNKVAKDVSNGPRRKAVGSIMKTAKDAENGKYGEYGKRAVKHESIDPVYEDLCRMGIID